MRPLKPKRRGQALLLVTFALFAMCGLLGLAVDLGWGYFVKKSAQASADAGALAGAYQALAIVGQNGTITCGTGGITCPSSPGSPCDLTGNLQNACQFAEQGGFAAANVKIAAGANGTPPTGQSISVDYWVTVRSVQTIPQLFSAVLGNPTGISSARATAAITTVLVNGSLIALNRNNDPGPGYDVELKGHGTLNLPSGLYAASTNTGNTNNGIQVNGATSINGPIFQRSPATDPGAGGTNTFEAMADGPQFLDPMRGLGQPPLPATALNSYAVVNSGNLNQTIYQVSGNQIIGTLSTGLANVTLPPGNYFPAIQGKGSTVSVDTSGSIRVSANVTFSGGSFGAYFFYGGLTNSGTMTMGPGQYVIVGGNRSGNGLNDLGVIQAPNPGGDAGQMIIVTGTSSQNFTGAFPNLGNTQEGNLYPGLVTQLNSNILLAQMATTSTNPLGFGQTTFFKSADGTGDLRGVNPSTGALPTNQNPVGADLSRFTGVVFWQDQANSQIKYTSSGNIDTSCGGINSPCSTSYHTSPNIDFHAQGDASMDGIFYQPRGAGLTSIGHGNSGDISGNLQIITGWFHSNGGGGLDLNTPTVPLKRRIVALLE